MPPPPELLRVPGLIGRVEVLGQIETHQHSHADSHIRIAGEVRIDLQRIGEERKQVLESREQQRVVKHTVDDVHCQIIGHDDFLRQAVENPEDRQPEEPAAEAERLVQLRNELLRTDNRTCH